MEDKQKSLKKLIPLKHSLKQVSKFQKISDMILCYLNDIPEIDVHKTSNELILLIMNLIEHLVRKKLNIDKKLLLISTLSRALKEPLTDEEKLTIESAIEFLHSNKLIKKITNLENIKFFLKEYLCPKL